MPEEEQRVLPSLCKVVYAIGTRQFAYGLCRIWPTSLGFGHYKKNQISFTSLLLPHLGTKPFVLFTLELPGIAKAQPELHPLHA